MLQEYSYERTSSKISNDPIGFRQVFKEIPPFEVAEVFWNASKAGCQHQLLHFMLFGPLPFVCITFVDVFCLFLDSPRVLTYI